MKTYDRFSVKLVVVDSQWQELFVLIKVAPFNINQHLSSRRGDGRNVARSLDIGTIGSGTKDGANKGIGVSVRVSEKSTDSVVNQGGYQKKIESVSVLREGLLRLQRQCGAGMYITLPTWTFTPFRLSAFWSSWTTSLPTAPGQQKPLVQRSSTPASMAV